MEQSVKPVMGTRVSCFRVLVLENQSYFMGFSPDSVALLLWFILRFFFLLRCRRFWIRSCMKVSYLMSVIFYFTFPFYRQPEIIKLTGNF